MTLFVLDASVAAKWVLPRKGETLVDEAFDLLAAHSRAEVEFVAPDLFWAELGNILWKACWQGRWSEKSAVEALDATQTQKITTVPTRDVVEDALKIAIASGRTIYDCLYVAVAVRSKAQLVTADERLANALAARFPIRWLGLL